MRRVENGGNKITTNERFGLVRGKAANSRYAIIKRSERNETSRPRGSSSADQRFSMHRPSPRAVLPRIGSNYIKMQRLASEAERDERGRPSKNTTRVVARALADEKEINEEIKNCENSVRRAEKKEREREKNRQDATRQRERDIRKETDGGHRSSSEENGREKVRRAQNGWLSLSLPLSLSRSLKGWNVTRFEEAVGWTRRCGGRGGGGGGGRGSSYQSRYYYRVRD